MYGMQIDTIKLALQRYRTAYLDAEAQKKNATDNYRQNIIWKVKSDIEAQLAKKALEQGEKVRAAAAEIMQQIGTGSRAKGADLTEDYQLLQSPAFDLDAAAVAGMEPEHVAETPQNRHKTATGND